MDKRIKKLWIDALRSEKYKQGKGGLRNNFNEFCCLGVLCDLYSKEQGARWRQTSLRHDKVFRIQRQTGVLPNKVAEWAGIGSNDGLFKYKNDKEDSRISLNDIELKSFKQIARVIEKYF